LLKFLKIDQLLEKLTSYIEVRIELFKLEVKEDIGRTIAKAAFWGGVFLLLCFALALISFGFSYWLGEVLGGIFYGFFIVGGVYIAIILLVLGLEKKLNIIEKATIKIQEALKKGKDDK